MSVYRDVLKKISPFMKAKGFLRSGYSGRFYYVANDIAYCVTFEKPSILIYVTAYIIPLYIPTNGLYYTYGSRLRNLHGLELPILTEDEMDLMDQWCGEFCRSIEEKILPVFQMISSPEALIGELERESPALKWFFRCQPHFTARLMMYTYFYLQKIPETELAIENYRNALAHCSYLNKTMRLFQERADVIEALLHKSKTEREAYIADTIESTKQFFKKAFNKTTSIRQGTVLCIDK